MIVVKPLYSQVYCSSQNERKALSIIFLCSIVSIAPYYYYRSNINAQNILKVISAVLSLLGPWCICVILWILLLRIVNRETGLKKSKQFILHSEVVAQRLKSKSKMTKMVLIICFFNITCQLPVLILTIFGLINGNPCGYGLAIFFVCLLFLSNLLLIVNHSINFFIYSLTNYKFRYTLKIMCRRCFYSRNRLMLERDAMMTTIYSERRRTTNQKYDCDSRSNSKTHDSPRVVNTTASKHLSDLNHNNLKPVAL
jgi:hypothetical protein